MKRLILAVIAALALTAPALASPPCIPQVISDTVSFYGLGNGEKICKEVKIVSECGHVLTYTYFLYVPLNSRLC